jgi:4-hydroxy-tetrahydrodipicolinate synthase
MFAGTHTALITPFKDGDVDYDAFHALIDHQAEAGIDGIVPVGTTGESPTLNPEEHLKVIAKAVEFSAGRLKVIAGTGANSTREAVHLTQAAEKLGADASLQVCPYYNKPSQEGLYQHYKAVADATKLPIMLYSIPGRSVIEIAIDTIVRLAQDCPNIIANKEAGGSVDRINELVQAVPAGFEILSGDDPLTLPFMSCGAVGLVSVAGNIIPDVMARLVRACANGSYDEALELQKRYYPLFKTLMTLDTNPVPIKSALALTGKCTPELRRPLVNLSPEKTATLKTCLEEFELM